MSFGERLRVAFESYGHLCVGLDPHPYLLDSWGLTDDASGLRAFSQLVLEASVGRAGIVKPQVAFFERHGSAGYGVLEEVLAEARASGLLVIADAKRGDVGTSVEAYGEAWLSPGSSLEADAMTVAAFQGFDSLRAVVDRAEAADKGVFVLAATSNPESREPQTARIVHGPRSGLTVGAGIVAQVAEWNQRGASAASNPEQGERIIGSVGVVLGATAEFETLGIDVDGVGAGPVATPVLAPGFGHQGAGFENIRTLYRRSADVTIMAVSRSILSHGPAHLTDAIARHQESVSGGLR